MGPARTREPSIERTDEYEEFMRKLVAFHKKRGTTLEREPKVGSRHVDLLRLYEKVVEQGGYDVVSDSKGNKLAWRRLSQDFNFGTANLPSQAFMLKSAYYKNLVAFEISDFHEKEPPPKEILEDVSAKGGNVLTRTVENFARTVSREAENVANGHESEDENEDAQKTPKEEKVDDEPGSNGGRTTRGLRHAPPQRVLFQPDTSLSRQTRHSSHQNHSPAPTSQPMANGTYATNGVSTLLATWEPSRPLPLTLKPVATPGNNPEWFKQQEKVWRERHSKVAKPDKRMMLPGTGYPGPNIYIRCLLALQSRIREEEACALHHLVKISHERGDKYRFDGFPGLAEALTSKVLEVTELFYDIRFDVVHEDSALRFGSGSTVDPALASELLRELRSSRVLLPRDSVETEDFVSRLALINEASLVIRNMVMLEDNAEYASSITLIRDMLMIVLRLPRHHLVIELQHYTLEIAEQLTKYFVFDSNDPLYTALLAQLASPDRGILITSLRAITRISMNLDNTNRLGKVPMASLERLCKLLLVDDEELRSTCFDFFYQFTALPENVELLLGSTDIEGFVSHLVRLLLYNARHGVLKQHSSAQANKSPPLAEHSNAVPRIPPDLVEQLLTYDEPERSSQWLRCCFEEVYAGEITQILLWQAYQSVFVEFSQNKPLLPAKDFITNVSNTFSDATAQVLNGPSPKFIIKGIVPKEAPVDPKGRPYMKCLWEEVPAPGSITAATCGEYRLKPEQMWEHVITSHLHVPKGEDGKYVLTKAEPDTSVSASIETPYATPPRTDGYRCRWGHCRRFSAADSSGIGTAFEVGMHVKTHLPDGNAEKSALKRKHHVAFDEANPKPGQLSRAWPTRNTPTDERNAAAGLALTAALVLRNVARGIGKIDDEGGRKGHRNMRGGADGERDGVGWIERVFAPVREQLFFVMAYNSTLKEQLSGLMRAIGVAEGS